MHETFIPHHLKCCNFQLNLFRPPKKFPFIQNSDAAFFAKNEMKNAFERASKIKNITRDGKIAMPPQIKKTLLIKNSKTFSMCTLQHRRNQIVQNLNVPPSFNFHPFSKGLKTIHITRFSGVWRILSSRSRGKSSIFPLVTSLRHRKWKSH